MSAAGGAPMFSLAGKTVVVTGGGKGIGRGIATAMAHSGAQVVITGRDGAALGTTVKALEALGANALAVTGDSPALTTVRA